jgi:hypothetical protein
MRSLSVDSWDVTALLLDAMTERFERPLIAG